MKLSKPQLDLLTLAVAAGKTSCSVDYAPARKLVELGLVTSHEGRLGGHHVEPTELGYAEHRKIMRVAR